MTEGELLFYVEKKPGHYTSEVIILLHTGKAPFESIYTNRINFLSKMYWYKALNKIATLGIFKVSDIISSVTHG